MCLQTVEALLNGTGVQVVHFNGHGKWDASSDLTDLQLEQDVKGLVQFYQSQGFPEVKVSPQIANAPDIFGPVTANFSLVRNQTGATVTGANNLPANTDPVQDPDLLFKWHSTGRPPQLVADPR